MGNIFSNVTCNSNTSKKSSIVNNECSISDSSELSNISELSDIPIKYKQRVFTKEDFMKRNILFKKLYVSIVENYYSNV
tara:strand:- start:222 stop:458 length:237 start_codon:yes stop_codon:yes gene_type:complete